MNYEIERKILNNLSLTKEEVNIFLNFVCTSIRKEVGIEDPMDTNCKECFDTSIMFGRLILSRFGCDVEILNIKKELEIPLTHYANLISLNVNGNKKTYLVDMTYSQFFDTTITLDDIEGVPGIVVTTDKTFEKIKEVEFIKNLRQNGFIELNDIILKKYIDLFLDICKVNNKEKAYKNIQKLLLNNNFNVKIKQ